MAKVKIALKIQQKWYQKNGSPGCMAKVKITLKTQQKWY